MSTVYKNHGINARIKKYNLTQHTGRYTFQKKSENRIPSDVKSKLSLNSSDICLDIGCNVGNILIPLSKSVKSITGMDHPECISMLKKRNLTKNIRLIGGDFMKYKFQNKFDKIIIYSVIHTLDNNKEIKKFINRAISLLKCGGSILIGDIPNISTKKRFLSSEIGRKYNLDWKKKFSLTKRDMEFQETILNNVSLSHIIDDHFIMELIKNLRKKNYNAYLLPQPKYLPFGRTREDLLIVKG